MDKFSILKQNLSSNYSVCLENKEFEEKRYNEHILVHSLHEMLVGKNFNENFYLENEFINPSFIFDHLEKIVSNDDFLVYDSPRYFVDNDGNLSDEGDKGLLETFKNTRTLSTIQLGFNLPTGVGQYAPNIVYDKYIEEIDKWIREHHVSKTLIYNMTFFKAPRAIISNEWKDPYCVQIRIKHLN